MEVIRKFQDLEIDNTYSVLGFSDSKKSKYGKSYILIIKNIADNSEFKIWSTKFLAKYISTEKPTEEFQFTVHINDENIKYPVIEGYVKKFKMLAKRS